jgi:hypothetical protein
VVHNSGTGVLSSSAVVNADIAAATIDLTTKVTGVLPIANGGTNTLTAPVANSVVIGNAGGTAYTSLASVGSAGQVLTSAGAGVVPGWSNPGATINLSVAATTAINVQPAASSGFVTGSQSVYPLSTTGGSITLHGFSGGTDGRLIVLVNVSAAGNSFVISSNDASATAATDEIHYGGASPIILGVDGTITLMYDAHANNTAGNTGAWRVIANY